eukprot:758083-Hanusia_phi.AAC.2
MSIAVKIAMGEHKDEGKDQEVPLQSVQKEGASSTPINLLIEHSNMEKENPISRQTIEAMGAALIKESFVRAPMLFSLHHLLPPSLLLSIHLNIMFLYPPACLTLTSYMFCSLLLFAQLYPPTCSSFSSSPSISPSLLTLRLSEAHADCDDRGRACAQAQRPPQS